MTRSSGVGILDPNRLLREWSWHAIARTWFAEADADEAAEQGLSPGPAQCIAFEIPILFAESANALPYLADIYDHLGFLGDLHRQLATFPDGTKVELVIKPTEYGPLLSLQVNLPTVDSSSKCNIS